MWKGIISFAIQDRIEVTIERCFEKSALARYPTESFLEYSKKVFRRPEQMELVIKFKRDLDSKKYICLWKSCMTKYIINV